MSVGWRMLFPSYAPELAVVAMLLALVWLRWRYVRSSMASGQRYALTKREFEVNLLAPIEPGDRSNRAFALALAAIAWKGDPMDSEGMLSLADEFLQYIEGNDAIMPRPDPQVKGRMPR